MYFAQHYVLFVNSLYLVNCFRFIGFDFAFKNTRRFISNDSSTTKWIEQPVDHFNESDTRTWNMRYFENLDFWQPNGPIFLHIFGETEAYPTVDGYLISDLAKETGGAIFVAEHRYYGKSQPFTDINVENLSYLSSKQALADFRNVLQTIKSGPEFITSKVVAVGYSYAGNLAAWIRLLYPTLVDAAISSSGPVLAKKDFYEYLETVNDVYQKYGTNGCIEKISQEFSRYDQLFQSADGIDILKEEEQICNDTDLTVAENRQLFFLSKTETYMVGAQYGTIDYIKKVCNYVNYVSRVTDFDISLWKEELQCYSYDFLAYVKGMKRDNVMWTYQTCTEYGYFQSTSSDQQPFTKNIPVDFYYKICTALFGKKYDEERVDVGVNITNQLYGGRTPNVSNVVFVNGELDPYHRLGVLEDISEDAPAIIIVGASHCRDVSSIAPDDSEELREGKQRVKNYILKWIGV